MPGPADSWKTSLEERGQRAATDALKRTAGKALTSAFESDEQRAEREAAEAEQARARKAKWVLGGFAAFVVVIGGLWMLSAFYGLLKWAFVLGVLGLGATGGYLALRPRLDEVRGRLVAKREARAAEEQAEAAAKAAEMQAEKKAVALEDELAALKAKADGDAG